MLPMPPTIVAAKYRQKKIAPQHWIDLIGEAVEYTSRRCEASTDDPDQRDHPVEINSRDLSQLRIFCNRAQGIAKC